MTHQATIIPGSLKRNAITGGIEFQMQCCGELPHSVHIQNLAAYETHDQRIQIIQQHLDQHSERHAAEVATEEFLQAFVNSQEMKGDCGCPK